MTGFTKITLAVIVTASIAIGGLGFVTFNSLKPVPENFQSIMADSRHIRILDRNGTPLNMTYQNIWNINDTVSLYTVPTFLKQAFIISEDKRFYQHHGPDWRARAAAALANIKNMSTVRGASTITEQVVRMIIPRPRTVWSRWLEGFEATRLEDRYSKDAILEFYLNQVPYAANRRGIVQAAQYYFNRDLETLNKKEMLALAVLVRAPSRMDLWKNPKGVEAGIARLSDRLIARGLMTAAEKDAIAKEKFELDAPTLSTYAPEFIRYVQTEPMIDHAGWPTVRTSLDAQLQSQVQTLLDQRIDRLSAQKVRNGAVLVVNHQTGEILSWAVAGKDNDKTPGRYIDAVTTPRQPGSALKPFLYTLALDKGWTAATIINDAPLTEMVGNGLHSYHNYSRSFYGPVTLRQALGNSLNIPALKTIQYVGAENYLRVLDDLGFTGLSQHPNVYGDGIALGNGAVTLLELVQAYTALANHGVLRPLNAFTQHSGHDTSRRIFSAEAASLMGLILSDPDARALEFGSASVLNLPIQTAVKTGTSSDYRDSWAVGYNYRYTVGIWMGNLDQEPTDGITGSTGPALLLRSVFSILNRHQETRALPIHKRLIRRNICAESGALLQHKLTQNCTPKTEWFIPGSEPTTDTQSKARTIPIRMRRPTRGLHIAYDPRRPDSAQGFEFFIQGLKDGDKVEWIIDNQKAATTNGGAYLWPIEKGKHQVTAIIRRNNKRIKYIRNVDFLVK
ncbi:MAG: transglycosylase domain-containing protein [Pseudomonadota bacterium]